MEKLNVQMYSLGWGNTDPMPESFKKLAAMGYTGVEFAGSNYGGMSVEEMKQALELLYRDREELAERGKRLRTYMLGRKCRIEDKIDWLEKELKCLVAEE